MSQQQSPWQAQSAALQMQQLGMMSEQMNMISVMNGLLANLNTGFTVLVRAINQMTAMLSKILLKPQGMETFLGGTGRALGMPTQLLFSGVDNIISDFETKLLAPLEAVAIQAQSSIKAVSGSSGGKVSGPFSTHGSLLGNPAEILKSMIPATMRGIGTMAKSGYTAAGGGGTGVWGGMVEGSGKLLDNMKAMFKGGLGNTAKAQAKSVAQPFIGALSSLGPQMAMMAIVMAPVQALLEGLFEPFEMITDIFGAYGSILGQMFIPILMAIQPILLSMLPIFEAIAPMLGQLILMIFQFMTPIGLLLPLFEAIMPFLMIGIQFISGLIEQFALLMSNFKPLEFAFSLISGLFMGIYNTIMGIPEGFNSFISFFTVTIPGYFSTAINNLISLFTGIGTSIAEIIKDLWTEITSLGVTKTKWFG